MDDTVVQNYVYVGGEPYVRTEYLATNPNALNELVQYYFTQLNTSMAVDQPQPAVRPKSEKSNVFVWSPELHTRFAIICAAFGVKTVTPKQIQACLGKYVNRESVGSHLQKFRLKILKEYGLQSSTELTDRHIPKNIENRCMTKIKQAWDAPEFTGFTMEEVRNMLEDY